MAAFWTHAPWAQLSLDNQFEYFMDHVVMVKQGIIDFYVAS